MEKEKVFAMKLSRVYPLLVQKAERKGRTKQEVDEVICWLTGYDETGFTINDPFSAENSSRTWSYSQLEPQILNIWAIKKAEEQTTE